MSFTRTDIEEFFSRYQDLFNRAVSGDDDLGDIKNLYADEFIAATPHGAHTGKIDADFESVMAKGYERYRAIGTKSMEVHGIDIHDIDDAHCLARVRWDSVYQQSDNDEIHVPFEVSYLLEQHGDGLRVFGWVSGDEQELLKANGIL
jgi:hypothetical protein